MTVQCFDIELAVQYGMKEAVIINNLRYWLQKNAANESNIHDGEVWTYNTLKAWHRLLPYLSQRQVERTLSGMESKGLIAKGNYNKSKYDRTCWYTLKHAELRISPYAEMEKTKAGNGSTETVTPIPKSYQGVTSKHKSTSRFAPPSLEEIQLYITEKNYQVSAIGFMSHYESNGWKVGKNKMKCWKSALTGWEVRNAKNETHSGNRQTYRKTAADRAEEYHDTLKTIYAESVGGGDPCQASSPVWEQMDEPIPDRGYCETGGNGMGPDPRDIDAGRGEAWADGLDGRMAADGVPVQASMPAQAGRSAQTHTQDTAETARPITGEPGPGTGATGGDAQGRRDRRSGACTTTAEPGLRLVQG